MTKRATASALLTITVIGSTGGSALAQSVDSEATGELPTPDPEGPVQLVAGGESVDALDLLALLAVEPEVDEGYGRALFEYWVDADGTAATLGRRCSSRNR